MEEQRLAGRPPCVHLIEVWTSIRVWTSIMHPSHQIVSDVSYVRVHTKQRDAAPSAAAAAGCGGFGGIRRLPARLITTATTTTASRPGVEQHAQ